MEDIKRILVVSQLSQHCTKAVQYGVSLCRKYKAKLYVLHVIYDPFAMWQLPMMGIHSAREEYKKIQEQAKTRLDEIIHSERTKGTEIAEYVKVGKPLDEILKVIEKEKIELAITVAHKEGRLEHFLFCRDIETIIRTMPCSVMLVKEDLTD